MSDVHRILGHGWQPGSRVPIDVAVTDGQQICRVRRTGIYRYMGYLSYFEINLGGKKVKLGGDEMHDPLRVTKLPRDADCGRER